ncbi:hypothetical protein FQZ97_894790 [compost metagenome]
MAGGDRLEPAGIAVQFGQGHLAVDQGHALGEGFRAGDLAAAADQVGGDVADIAFGRADFDGDYRLQHHFAGGAQGVDHGLAPGGLEGDVLGVHRVVLAVVDGDLEVFHRQPGQRAAGQHRAHALLHRGDELRGDDATLHLVGEEEAATARQGLDAQVHLAELPRAAGLLLVAAVAFGRTGDGFAVGHLGRTCLHLQLVGAGDAIEQVAQVQFAHAAQHGLLGGGLVVELHAGVFGL